MLHPHDMSARKKFRRAYIGESFERLRHKVDKFPTVPHALQLRLARESGFFGEAAVHAVGPAFKAFPGGARPSYHGGPVAGAQLLRTLFLAIEKGYDVGRNIADDEISDWLRAAPNHFKKARPRDMMANWKRYRGAAHFWAASNVLGMMPQNEVEFCEFISLAEELGKWGEIYKPKGARKSLLDNRDTYRAGPLLKFITETTETRDFPDAAEIREALKRWTTQNSQMR